MIGKREIFTRLVFSVIRFYWFIFRPESWGVKCVIENTGSILLIRNTYGRKQWTFPGGSIEKNESPEDATKREVREEVGLQIENLIFLGQFLSTREYKKDNVLCFCVKAQNKEIQINSTEILEAKWFFLDELPFLGPSASKTFKLYETFPHT